MGTQSYQTPAANPHGTISSAMLLETRRKLRAQPYLGGGAGHGTRREVEEFGARISTRDETREGAILETAS
jgi:hypothetical protein